MSDLHKRLRADLTDALRARDRESVRVLRTVLAAIANAEAQPAADLTPMSLRSEGVIAGPSMAWPLPRWRAVTSTPRPCAPSCRPSATNVSRPPRT